jgi:glycosyltransferase involved in cell wall biosynthesis
MAEIKKRICFVSLSAYPLFNPKVKKTYGGTEVQMYRLAIETAKSPLFKTSFVTGDFGQKDSEYLNNISVYKSIPDNYKSPIYYVKFWLVLLKTKADLFIQRSAGSTTFATALFCRLFGKKFVYMAASTIDCNGEYVKANGLMGKLFLWSLKQAALVISQSYDQQKMLKSIYSINSAVIKNSIDIPLPNNSIRKYITWISRTEKYKNPEIFLKLALEIPQEEFVMIAPTSGDQKYSRNIMKETAEIENLIFIPGTDYPETQKYLKLSKYLVHTSRFEGFPNTFIEAATLGVPIISLYVNPDNFINIYNCGLYAEGIFNTICDYIRHNPKKDWLTASENIYKYAKEKHNLEINALKFREAICGIN